MDLPIYPTHYGSRYCEGIDDACCGAGWMGRKKNNVGACRDTLRSEDLEVSRKLRVPRDWGSILNTTLV